MMHHHLVMRLRHTAGKLRKDVIGDSGQANELGIGFTTG